MGKTWVGNLIARAVAGSDQAHPAMVFSAEMNIDQLAARFVATEAQINLGAIMERRWSDQEFNALMLTDFDHLPIYLDDTVGSELTMAHIESQCQQVRRKHGAIGVVVVDYIQLLGNRGGGNRAGELGHYSGALAGLGKKLNCPVVALAQLNRAVESRNNKRPILSDLKESGDIEQDAFTVIFLNRDDYYADEKSSGDEFIPLELIFAKNRNGPCGIATVQFQPSTGAIGAGPAIYDY
jgi:replicative DNA helicase